MEKCKILHPFWLLLFSIILNMCTFFVLYRMIVTHGQKMNTFIFNHRNDPETYHPLCEKLSIKVEQLQNDFDIIRDKTSSYKQR